MKKCKHAVVFRFSAPGCEHRRCAYCNSLVPFAPSNDAPPEVQIEIRAAEIVEEGHLSGPEYDGWGERADEDPVDDCEYAESTRLGRHAGWLAHTIVNHDEEQAVHEMPCCRGYGGHEAWCEGGRP